MSFTLHAQPVSGPDTDGPRLIGDSAVMRRLDAQLDALARRQCTALLQGESGTGKELAARIIHARSARGRAGAPFVPVDCTTLRDTLFESQLFGHARGAFTGADRPTLGFVRAADGGTLFLDEIGELPLPGQAKLLRCIQEGQVVPLGTTQPIAVDVRVVAATHRDLAAMVARGEFRQDLYYRLNVARLRLPPLRQRREDILPLAEHALGELARLYREPARRLGRGAAEAMLAYDWPGNVRELVNAVEHALVFSGADGDTIEPADLPDEVRRETRDEDSPAPAADARLNLPLMTLAAAERSMIEAALRASKGNQSRAAQLLAVERHRLRRKIELHGLSDLIHGRG